jgi:hypothetical protein
MARSVLSIHAETERQEIAMNHAKIIWIGHLVAAFLALPALAQAPLGSAWTYQGVLTQNGDAVNQPADFRFSLWNAPVAGTQVGPTIVFDGGAGNQPPIDLDQGVFTTQLDFGFDVFNGNAIWLQIGVRAPHDPTDTQSYTTLTPRQPLTAAPYALQTRGIVVDQAGDIGIGVPPSSDAKMHVLAEVQVGGFVGGAVVIGHNTATTGIDSGVIGVSDSVTGRGVAGIAQATIGENIGVGGHTASTEGYAGYFTGAPGSGNYFQRHMGIGTLPTDDTMLRVTAAIQAGGFLGGAVVLGQNTATAGIDSGVMGASSSTNGRGVAGIALASSGPNIGVGGHTSSPNGYAGYFTGTEGSRNYFERSVGIGTLSTGNFALAVNGSIRAKEIIVETGWSDFVFEPDYKLATLDEVERHISEHGHLPDIPSAAEVAENGVKVGEMESRLLRKIEELTLHMIDMNKRVAALEAENSRLKDRLHHAVAEQGG